MQPSKCLVCLPECAKRENHLLPSPVSLPNSWVWGPEPALPVRHHVLEGHGRVHSSYEILLPPCWQPRGQEDSLSQRIPLGQELESDFHSHRMNFHCYCNQRVSTQM